VGTSAAGLPLQPWFGTSFYSYLVFEDPKWDYRTMDFRRDLSTALTKVGSILDSNDPDLRRFRDRGGKLIQFHGWGDAAIPATASIEYYERVKRTLAKDGAEPLESFYRLFMAPGLGHCAGGMGPNDFGNLGMVGLGRSDPDRDIHAALERWVEQGVAPERIVAEGVRPGDPPHDPAKGIKITRPLCPYPKTARYRGIGSSDDAASFTCSERR
jgi:feruloyl esterase